MSDNCVYFHVNPIKQEVFYVGIGKLTRPYYEGKERSTFWHNEVNKYGYDIIVLHESLSWETACKLEVKYIAQIGRRDLKLGPLVNHTNGGDGTGGYIYTEEVKFRLRKPKSEAFKQQVSKTMKLKGLQPSKIAKENSKLSCSKPVLQFSLDGVLRKE